MLGEGTRVTSNRLRLGMVGGGPGSFIGPVHMMAARIDGACELVCGAFSRDAENSTRSGAAYGVDSSRAYGSFTDMITAEARRDDDAMQAVVIVTPNHMHFPVAKAALEAGFHVFSDKPVTATLAEAEELTALVRRTELAFGVSYTYSGYPLIREARRLCAAGELGAIRKVVVEYSQGWLGEKIEETGSKQASWRTDPSLAGMGGCIGDIGVHAFHLLEFTSGHRVDRLTADLSHVVPGRILDDDCNILIRLDNGAPGVIVSSQISTGERNGLRLRLYGERASLLWSQEQPDQLHILTQGGPRRILYAGDTGSQGPAAVAATRLPSGHPEGYLEAFGNLYRDFAAVVDRHRAGVRGASLYELLPSIVDGLRGMAFIETVVTNAAEGGWTTLAPPRPL